MLRQSRPDDAAAGRLATKLGWAAGAPDWWLLPTGPVGTGAFTVDTRVVLVPPVTKLRVLDGDRDLALDFRYATPEVSVPAGTQSWTSDDIRYTRQILLPVPKLRPGFL